MMVAAIRFSELLEYLPTACKDDDEDNVFAAWDSINDKCYCRLLPNGWCFLSVSRRGFLPGGELYTFENQGSAGVSRVFLLTALQCSQ